MAAAPDTWELTVRFRTRGAPEDLNCVRWTIDPEIDGRGHSWIPDVRLVHESIDRVPPPAT